MLATARVDGAQVISGAVIDLETGNEVLEIPAGFSTLSRDGTLVLAGNDPLELWDVAGEQKLREYKAFFMSAWFSPTGTKIYGTTADGRIVVFDRDSADLLFELRGRGSTAVRVQMTDDESKISAGGSVAWDLDEAPLRSTSGSVEFPASLGGEPAFFVIVETFLTSDHLVTLRAVMADERALAEPLPTTQGHDETTVYDLQTGEVIASYSGSLLAVSPDGDTVALQRSGPLTELTEADTAGQAPPGTYLRYEGVEIVDLATGRPLQELEGLCTWFDGPPASPHLVESDECVGYPASWRDYVNNASFSSDGSFLAMAGETGRFAVWDVNSGEMIWSQDAPGGLDLALTFSDANVAFSPDGEHLVTSWSSDAGETQPAIVAVREVGAFDSIVAEFETNIGGPATMEFTPDGALLVLNDQGLDVFVVEAENWERVHVLSGNQGSLFPDIAVDPTGRFVATAGEDGVSIVWNLETGEEVQRFVVPQTRHGLRNVEWLDDKTLMLGTRFWTSLMTLDNKALVDAARERLTRTFAPSECATYQMDPCPTLAEVTSVSARWGSTSSQVEQPVVL